MHKISLFFFLAVGICANSIATAAIVVPYSNDFSTSVADLSSTLEGQWSLASGTYKNEILATASNKSSSSLLQFSDLGGSPSTAKDFSLRTTFTITSSVGDFNSLGFAILSNNADATTNSSSLYLADIFKGGGTLAAQLRFAEIGLTPTLTTTVFDMGKILLQGVPYVLQLDGNYADNGDLNLKLELIDNNDVSSFQTTIPSANVLTGNYFGLRDRASGGVTSALTVEYDSLNITAIPEPSSIGFVAASLLGGYAIGRYWHRRQKNNA